MAIVYLSPIGNSVIPFLNANGAPNANGFLSTFLAGTSTPSATYTTSAGSVQNAVSIPLGPDGRVPNEVWLVSGIAYKFTLLDSTLALIPGCTYDNITGINDPAAFGTTGTPTFASLTVTGATATGSLSVSGAASVIDGNFTIVGSSDATKKAKFEVDGLTTATTRTITVPDRDLTLGLTLLTPQASTSGTSIDFTGIPSSARRIIVMFNGVSTNGTSTLIIQIGDSGGIETASYLGDAASLVNAAAVAVIGPTTGFGVTANTAAGSVIHGAITLHLMNVTNNTWVSSGGVSDSGGSIVSVGHGCKSTSAVTDRVRITTLGGANTFDLGEINVGYE